MNTSVIRYFLLRNDGKPVNIRYEPVKTLNQVAKWGTYEEADYFLREGYYKSFNPNDYSIQTMTIKYMQGEIEDV